MQTIAAQRAKDLQRLVTKVFRPITFALHQLHMRNIAHLDLKIDNMMYRHMPEGKEAAFLIDFDSAQKFHGGAQVSVDVGTTWGSEFFKCFEKMFSHVFG